MLLLDADNVFEGFGGTVMPSPEEPTEVPDSAVEKAAPVEDAGGTPKELAGVLMEDPMTVFEETTGEVGIEAGGEPAVASPLEMLEVGGQVLEEPNIATPDVGCFIEVRVPCELVVASGRFEVFAFEAVGTVEGAAPPLPLSVIVMAPVIVTIVGAFDTV